MLAGGRPLVFFHFSGYDPATPYKLSRHQGTAVVAPRIRLSDEPVVVDLLAWYDEQLERLGHSARRQVAYRWGSVGGEALSEVVRRMYRRAVLGLEFGTEAGPAAFVDEVQSDYSKFHKGGG